MSDMGGMQDFRQSVASETAEGRPIVAFDFDGTLTIRDSFTEFLRWRAGPGGWGVSLRERKMFAEGGPPGWTHEWPCGLFRRYITDGSQPYVVC